MCASVCDDCDALAFVPCSLLSESVSSLQGWRAAGRALSPLYAGVSKWLIATRHNGSDSPSTPIATTVPTINSPPCPSPLKHRPLTYNHWAATKHAITLEVLFAFLPCQPSRPISGHQAIFFICFYPILLLPISPLPQMWNGSGTMD